MFTDGQKRLNTLIGLRLVRKLFGVELKANILTKLCVRMAVAHAFGKLLVFLLEWTKRGENQFRKKANHSILHIQIL